MTNNLRFYLYNELSFFKSLTFQMSANLLQQDYVSVFCSDLVESAGNQKS